jgi:hypothetical protein
MDGIEDDGRGRAPPSLSCGSCTCDGVCDWDAECGTLPGPGPRNAGWSSGGMGGAGEADADARPLTRPWEPKVKPDDGEGRSLAGVICPCPLLECVAESSSCWEVFEGVPRLTCECDRDCETECEMDVPWLGAGEPRPRSPNSVRCRRLWSLPFFPLRPKVDHPVVVVVAAKLVEDEAGLGAPVRRVRKRCVRVGGWGCAVKGIGTPNSGRPSSRVSGGGGCITGVAPSMECLRVLGRSEKGGGEDGPGVESALDAGSAGSAGSAGEVQFATRESKSGCIFLSSGDWTWEAVGCGGAGAGVAGSVGPDEVNAEVPDKLFVLPRRKRAKMFAILSPSERNRYVTIGEEGGQGA